MVGTDIVHVAVVPSAIGAKTDVLSSNEVVTPVVCGTNIPRVHMSWAVRIESRDNEHAYCFQAWMRDDGLLVRGELDKITCEIDRYGHFTSKTC